MVNLTKMDAKTEMPVEETPITEQKGTGKYKTRARKKLANNPETERERPKTPLKRKRASREKVAGEDSKQEYLDEESVPKRRSPRKAGAEVKAAGGKGRASKSVAKTEVKQEVESKVKEEIESKVKVEVKAIVKQELVGGTASKVKKRETDVGSKKQKKKKIEDEPVPRPIKYESLGDGPPPVPSTGLKYMGCHVSGAGGVWNAFGNAEECSAKSFALFLRSQRQWAAKPLNDITIEKWKKLSNGYAPHLVLPHGSYLMNLGSDSKETLAKSRAILVEEMQRCQRLGIPHYNFHPGSTVGKMSRMECCKLIAEGINLAHRQTEGVICVLENMSCQGFTIGGDLHELRIIIEHVEDRSRVGVCLDTCHAHAAGYDLSTEKGFQKLLDDYEKIVGWQFLRGLHINDSKGIAGDHLDRHGNIGQGTIGIEGFRRVMNCDHFTDIPLILETPWTSNEGYAKEIKTLEALIEK